MPSPEGSRGKPAEQPKRAGGNARRVALGIGLSRLTGLVRQRLVANALGVGGFADVWTTALRLPNLLQNLLGEQTLSAAFIPVYSRLLEEGREDDARRFAGTIFSLLLLVVATVVLAGVLLARWVVLVAAWRYLQDAEQLQGALEAIDRYPLLVQATRFSFPMAGLITLAAWSLSILNSHRRFFLPYAAPVLWNVAICMALAVAIWQTTGFGAMGDAGEAQLEGWLFAALAGAVLGALLQFLVQLPAVLGLIPGIRPVWDLRSPAVAESLRMFLPALAGRGVVQLSLFLNMFLANNYLAQGGHSAVAYASLLFSLPLSLFGMSVAASELPELARRAGRAAPEEISGRVGRALRPAAFLMAPTVVGYWVFGFLVVGILFRGGKFGVDDQWLIYGVLLGYTLGLLPSMTSRLLQNTFFALGETRVPARIAAARLLVAVPLGVLFMRWLDRFSVADVVRLEAASPLYLGALGLSLADGVGAWVELLLLRRSLGRRLPGLRLPWGYMLSRLGVALVVCLPALALWAALAERSFWLQAFLVVPLYGASYLGLAWLRRSPELATWLGRG